MKRRFAFTLVEFLITIAIIGVVAAMTIPSLLQMYNNHITEIRLKKFYADFNNAIRMAEADFGPSDYWSDYWELANGKSDTWKTGKAVEKYFAPYMKISKVKNINHAPVFELPNGAAFGYPATQVRDIYFYPKNYKKCKDGKVKGQCTFVFQFVPSSYTNDKYWGRVRGKGLVPFLYLWNGTKAQLYSGGTYSCKNGGGYCVEIIRQNNWKIPKDYPCKISY